MTTDYIHIMNVHRQNREEKKIYERSYGIIPVHYESGSFLFLLVRHASGHWGIPKGHSKEGEDEIATATREFTEETGISQFKMVQGPTFTERYHFDRDDEVVEKTVKYFLANVENIKVSIPKNEIVGYGWFSFSDAVGMATHEETKRILWEAKEYADRHLIKNL